jgi:excisionase family DNA binding protein
MAPRFLSIAAFAQRYGVSRALTYKLIGEGKLLAVKIGGKTVIDFASAEAWADNLPALAAGAPTRLKAAMAARGLS